MTLNYVCDQLYDLSIAGYFNGEKFTRDRLHAYVRNMFRPEVGLKLKNRLVMGIALSDGWWNFYIIKLPNGEYDYWIPDTREQETRLVEELTGAAN